MVNKAQIGKRNRANGKKFELLTKKDLEEQGKIVDRWSNKVEFDDDGGGKLVGSKMKYNPFTKVMMMGSGGFPDFVAFYPRKETPVYGVECKINGQLKAEEKKQCDWLLENNVFSKIYIAYKEKVKNKVVVKYKVYQNL